jgi:hypothetical protein
MRFDRFSRIGDSLSKQVVTGFVTRSLSMARCFGQNGSRLELVHSSQTPPSRGSNPPGQVRRRSSLLLAERFKLQRRFPLAR